MALSAGVINIDLTLDNTKYQVSVTQAGNVTRQLSQELTTAQTRVEGLGTVMESFGSKIVSTAAGFAAFNLGFAAMHELFVSLPVQIVKASAEMERMTELMRGFSTAATFEGKEADAQKWSNTLLNMAQTTPMHLKNITDAFIKMKSAGLDPLDGTLQGTIEAISKFGGGSQQLEHAALALQQMAGKGAVSMEELRRQLAEVIPDAANKMAEGMGMSYATLMQHIQKGQVESKNAIQQMTTMWLIEDQGAAARMMGTWNGLMEQLQTKWFMFLNAVGKDGAFQQLKQTLQGLLDSFDGLSGKQFGHALGQDLNSLVSTFIAIKDAVVDYGNAIKVAGEFFLTYWAVSKVAAMRDAGVKMWQDIQKAGDVKAAAEEKNQIEARAAAIAGNALQQQKIAGLIAEQDAILALGERDRNRLMMQADLLEAQLNMERAAAVERQALRQQEMLQEATNLKLKIQMVGEELKARTDALNMYEAQATAANETIIALEEERAAIVNRLGEFGGKNQIADLDRQLQNQLQIAVATENAAAAQAAQVTQMRASIPVMREQQAQLETLAAAEIRVGVAGEESATMQINALREQAAAITQTTAVQAKAALQAEAAAAAEEGERLALVGLSEAEIAAARSAGVLGGALDALGGPLGIITGLLTLGATAWLTWGNSAEDAGKKADDALNSGLADKTTLQTYKTKLAGYQQELADAQKTIRDKGAHTEYGPEGLPMPINADPKAVADAQARVKVLTGLIAQTESNITEATAQIQDNEAQRREENEKRIRDRSFNERMSAFQTETERENQVRKDMLDRIGNDPGNKQKDAITRAGTEELKQRASAFYTNEIQIVEQQKQKAIANINSGNSAAKALGEKELKDLTDKETELQNELKRAQGLNTFKQVSSKPQKTVVDPLIRAMEMAKGQLDEAKVKARTIEDDSNSVAASVQRALIKINSELAAGKFNTKDANRTGDRVTVDQYGGLHGNQYEVNLVQYAAETDQINARSKAVAEMHKGISSDGAAAAEAMARLEGNTTKASSGMLALEKEAQKYKALFLNQDGSIRADLDATGQKQAQQWYQDYNNRKFLIASGDVGNLAADYADKTKKLNAEAVTNARQRAEEEYQVAYDKELQTYEMRRQMLLDTVTMDAQQDELKNAEIAALDEKWNQYKEAMAAKHQRDMEKPMDKLAEKWQSSTDAMNEATAKWAQSGVDALVNFVTTGKLEFGKFVESILADILKIKLEANLAKPMSGFMDKLGSALSGYLGLSNGTSGSAPSTTGQFGYTPINYGLSSGASTFANGGIMTNLGPLELRKYADGGIANRPQMAIYGEAGPEAYVPLPDGRTIPVTLQGGAPAAAPSVTVNVINQSGQQVNAQQGQPRFDGRKMILDVVLTGANQPGPFRDGMQAAMKG